MLAATGRTPAGIVLSPATRDLAAFVSLSCWLALMFAIGRRAAAVTAELVLARDTCQRALLQSQKLDALSKTAGSISHNFNNALMSMDYSTNLLAEALAGDAAYTGDVEVLEETVARCKTLSGKLERLGPSENSVALVSVATLELVTGMVLGVANPARVLGLLSCNMPSCDAPPLN